MLAFYDHAQLPGAIIIFVLVLLELIAMYLQARNASKPKWTSVWALLLTGIRMMLRSSRFSAARLIRS